MFTHENAWILQSMRQKTVFCAYGVLENVSSANFNRYSVSNDPVTPVHKQLNSLFHNLVYKWFITIITSDENKYRNKNCGPIKSKTSKAT